MSPSPESLRREQEALAATRAQVWQHVLLKYKILDQATWEKIFKAYNDAGAKIQIETILHNNGLVDEQTLMQLRSAAKVQILKMMLLQNKIITKEQWTECEQLQKQNPKLPIDRILIQKGYLDEDKANNIKGRLRMILGKWPEAGTPAEAKKAAPPPPPTAAKPQPPKPPGGSAISMDAVEEAPPAPKSPPPPPKQQPAPGGSAISMDAVEEDLDTVEFDDEGDEYDIIGGKDESGGSSRKRVGEMEWTAQSTETTDTRMAGESQDNLLSLDRSEDELDAIDLDEGEPTAKIIVYDGEGAISAGPGKLEGPKLVGAKPLADPADRMSDVEEEGDDKPHVESGVAPNDLDPEARQYLEAAVQAQASDLHLSAGSRPFMRLHGELQFFDAPVITADRARRMALGFMDDAQQQQFLRHHDLDFSFDGGPELGRCRVNALEQFRGPSIIFRIIPAKIPTLEDLGLPSSLGRLTEWTQGLVLVTGPAGCGKSTSAAALVDLVNSNRKDHIITVEDPVEYIHPSKNCNVTQRQVPVHTKTFAAALKAALREDPDVIMIGEMRDLETISLAMTAAETGHLVIGTLHTKSAARTIDRIVDVFPSDQQAQVRTMLSEALRGIITQQLVRRADGNGRVAALEVLYVNTAAANLIRDSKTFQLPSVMQTGRKQGQRLMDESLEELVKSGTITKEDAIRVAENPKRFQ